MNIKHYFLLFSLVLFVILFSVSVNAKDDADAAKKKADEAKVEKEKADKKAEDLANETKKSLDKAAEKVNKTAEEIGGNLKGGSGALSAGVALAMAALSSVALYSL